VSGGKRDPFSLLFVCVGNICRSPMAAGIARELFPAGVRVESAGIAPYGGHAAPEAVAVLRNVYTIDIGEHLSRDVADLPLETFDCVVAMDATVYRHLKECGRIDPARLLRWNIVDPFLRGPKVFGECAKDIRDRMEELVDVVRGRSGDGVTQSDNGVVGD